MRREEKSKPHNDGSLRAIFAIPLVLAVVTAVGLLSALLGDGLWNGLSWVALAIPVAVVVRCWRGAGSTGT